MPPLHSELLEQCREFCKNTLLETLKIEFIEVGEQSLTARMPVDQRVHQPDGVLHGGASIALAETVGSAAAIIFNKDRGVQVRGIEISANHVKSVAAGFVYATATAVHFGRTTQLWQIPVKDEDGNLLSMIKLTTITLASNK